MKLSQINIRDPFILPYDGKYYLYGTRVGVPRADAPWGDITGFDVYISEDLKEWSEPKSVFEKNHSFWADCDFWAPEVHFYREKFYMFASFRAKGSCRATHILVSDKPDGVFTPVTDKPITPEDWMCLDGTLYIDKKGKPHIVFCHEWLQIADGAICEMELSEDLTHTLSEPRDLWHASDYIGVRGVGETAEGFVTDGPFLFRDIAGTLLCMWSTQGKNGYVELLAKSDTGDIDGNWEVLDTPIFDDDGGHGMLFQAYDGNQYLVMHAPNDATKERPVLRKINIGKGEIHIVKVFG